MRRQHGLVQMHFQALYVTYTESSFYETEHAVLTGRVQRGRGWQNLLQAVPVPRAGSWQVSGGKKGSLSSP